MLNKIIGLARDIKGETVADLLYQYDKIIEYHRLLKVMAINNLRVRKRKKGSTEVRRKRDKSPR